ncbi:hypothetical protein PIB30_030626 [Stylosanthes scabra]|uniref:Ubiquitin-like protease family profile domain-containing protein n=1 Tax=Stylosanthes scabra TaxID=79078 RepID=A0ABU6XDC7_9FABA|nr:hypothetical protein [Stylosanthes scabra]
MRDHFMSLDREAEMDLVLFAPVLYGSHWWLYVIQVKGKKFYVLDSNNIKNLSGERMKLNRLLPMSSIKYWSMRRGGGNNVPRADHKTRRIAFIVA